MWWERSILAVSFEWRAVVAQVSQARHATLQASEALITYRMMERQGSSEAEQERAANKLHEQREHSKAGVEEADALVSQAKLKSEEVRVTVGSS